MAYASQDTVGMGEGGSNPLEGVFFVFDEDGGEETCPVDEILVYFYPEEGLELDQKLFLQGSISAMAAFAEQFGGDRAEVLLLKSVKFAIKRVPPFTLAATANVAVGDGELQHFLESLYAAYRFHFGGLHHVAERFCGARPEFLRCVQGQLGLLAPMLQAARRRSSLRSFVRLPFLSLPANCSRFFMAASQFLSRRRRREERVQAGAVFYDSSVLCTHTDIPLTRWIHSRLENLLLERAASAGWQRLGLGLERPSASVPSVALSHASAPNFAHASPERRLSASGGGDGGAANASAKFSSAAAGGVAPFRTCQAFPVFLTFEQLQDIGLRQSRPAASSIPEAYAYVAYPPPGGEYVTLVTIFVSRLCAALILPLEVLFDQDRQASLQQQAEQELAGLSSSVASAFHRNGGSSGGAGMRDSGNTPSQEFHFLTTDELTGMLKGSVLHKGVPFSEREERFLQGSAFAHELFRSDDISKILLGDPGGMLYCRNMFSKEVFYMRNGSSMSDVTLEKLEANAQYNLQRHNIQLI